MATTWLSYYLAVRRGDLETVRKALDKDFRISLTMDKGALEVAALHGHRNLVEYYLERVDVEYDFALIVEALKDALRGGYLELVKMFLRVLEPQKERLHDHFGAIAMSAISGGDLECVRLVWDLESEKEFRYYGLQAFSTGSTEMFQLMRELLTPESWNWGLKPKEGLTFYVDSDMPPSFLLTGLGDFEKAREHEELGREYKWPERKFLMYTADRLSLEPFSTMDVCGYFGQLEMLKTEIGRLKNTPDSDDQIEAELQSVMKFALRNNHKHILVYLIENELVTPKPPYEYEGFKINGAFYYLQEITDETKPGKPSKAMLMKNLKDGLHVLLDTDSRMPVHDASKPVILLAKDRSASRLGQLKKYYRYLLREAGEHISKRTYANLFMKALSEQNVDAALCFRRRMGKVTCETKQYHDLFAEALCDLRAYFQVIASPVVAELLMATFDGEEGECRCGSGLDPIEEFLKTDGEPEFPDVFEDEDPATTVRTILPLEVDVRRAQAVLQVISCDDGVMWPNSETIGNFLSDFFQSRRLVSVTAGKVLAVLQCWTIDVMYLDIEELTDSWLLHHWPKMDEMLTEFLIALARNMDWGSQIQMKGFLVFIMKPEDRRQHFLNCLDKLGIEVYDDFWDTDSARETIPSRKWKNTNRRLQKMGDRLPSLQEWARYSLHKHYLNVADKQPQYTSAETLLKRVSEYLPPIMRDFLQFSDVYATLNYKYPDRHDDEIHEDDGYLDDVRCAVDRITRPTHHT